ncbi:MAG: hypothetical protein Fur007_21510 [Rhodoferax sp.]
MALASRSPIWPAKLDIAVWKANAEYAMARGQGCSRWYAGFALRVVRVGCPHGQAAAPDWLTEALTGSVPVAASAVVRYPSPRWRCVLPAADLLTGHSGVTPAESRAAGHGKNRG